MSISQSVLNKVRERAEFSCEYCGISEIDGGGELTVDHFQPQSKGGGDEDQNLVYCCFRCNTYKGDFWNVEANRISLWNPRNSKKDQHFWLSETGKLYGLTKVGEFTIRLLRLNRQPLITKRQQDFQKNEERKTLQHSQKTIEMLIRLSQQQRDLLKEQQILLEEQRRLLEMLFPE